MVDENVVVAKLRSINQYTQDLKEMRGMSRDEYVDDKVIQRAVERTFMNLIQSCIDLAQHVRSAEGIESGGTSKEEIEALEAAEIISDETSERMIEAVGFRNILAHRYNHIDHSIVYDVLHEDLHWFEQFQQEIARWAREQKE